MSDLLEATKDERQLYEALKELDILRGVVNSLNEQLLRFKIVVQSKLTRRQQKIWPKWIGEVDLSPGLELKKTFPFPKIGLQAMDKGKWVRLTGTTQPEGLTKEEGAEICEYLNSFPENQHHLKNMDSEFREMPTSEEIAKSVEKL